MDAIASFLLNKGLDLAVEAAKSEIMANGREQAIYRNALEINNKIDLLLEGPFKEALYYLREKNYQRAKEKLIESLSLNFYHVPTLRLLIEQYVRERKPHIALKYLDDLFEVVGFRSDIIPKRILNTYIGKLSKRKFTIANNSPSGIILLQYHSPSQLWFTNHGIIIEWIRDRGYGDISSVITATDWPNWDFYININYSFSKVVFVSEKVLAVHLREKDGPDVFQILDITDGKIIKNMRCEEFCEIFSLPVFSYIPDTSRHIYFGGVIDKREIFSGFEYRVGPCADRCGYPNCYTLYVTRLK